MTVVATTPPLRRALTDYALLALGAALYTVASPPYEWSVAAWFTLTPLWVVARHRTPLWAGVAGFCYGVLACVGIAPWVYGAVSTYFSFPFPVDLLATVLSYGFFAGSYTGLVAALSCRVMQGGGPWLCRVGIPALWVSGEFARSSLFAGFSWWLLGYTQSHHLTLIQLSDLTGVYGLSFLMALGSYIVAEFLASFRLFQSAIRNPQSAIKLPWPALAVFLIGIGLSLLYGQMRLRQYATLPVTQSVKIALVQGEVSSTQRWQPAHYADALRTYVALTQRGVKGKPVDLVVWPEFAVGFYLDREPLLRAQLGELTQRLGAPLLLGAPRMDDSTVPIRYYNSAYLLAVDAQLTVVYDKMRLLPFAEYRPLALPVFLSHSTESPSEFTAGTRSTIFPLPPAAFGVLICYEATYPALARGLVQEGAQFLVNLSNDTWLGGGTAATQHFAMSVFRAVEHKRPLVRVATAGISGFVDPTGRPSLLSSTQGAVIYGELFPQQALTVYARWGDWLAWTCVGVAVIGLLSTRRK